MFSALLEELEGCEDTERFRAYLMQYYVNRTQQWAYCFRVGLQINTNMHLENFHRNLKYNYMLGRETKRMNRCISVLQEFLLDKEFDEIRKFHKGNINKKMTNISKLHNEGCKIISSVVSVDEKDSWNVRSASNTEVTYHVNRVDHECTQLCVVRCFACYACIKGYTCTCYDNALHGNLCKHIHAVAEYDCIKKTQVVKEDYSNVIGRNMEIEELNRVHIKSFSATYKPEQSSSTAHIVSLANHVVGAIADMQGEVPETIAQNVCKHLKSALKLIQM
ncbi:uncharacterized protein LOC111640648 [Centruroides sculpturatus]|uniref:uncharacterized protein LOC111640648 n=1 Tax=Centruroides sculpturatus TaxID=218467 RepID=UPI000C6E7644|nr:uncharacterized protein LOC111640648 [Centruroides sculpturatus]